MTTIKKIVVVDDDPAICRMMKQALESDSMTVATAGDGLDALTLIKQIQPDLVLTDAEMPGLDGHGLCRALRQEEKVHATPLMLMSGRLIDESHMLAGFEGGADDYILKPFSMPVVLARIKAVLRRYEAPPDVEMGLNLNPEERTALVDGKKVALTRKEFDLITELSRKPGRLLSVAHLLDAVWGYGPAYEGPGTVEAHISHLRKKLGPAVARRIVNVLGHGYRFERA